MIDDINVTWLPKEKPILASSSKTRQKLIKDWSIPVNIVNANIDERAVETQFLDLTPSKLAVVLSEFKTRHVAKQFKNCVVIGADQILDIEGKCLHKAKDDSESYHQLKLLGNRTHVLHSAVSIAVNGDVIETFCDSVFMTVKAMSDDDLLCYLDAMKDDPASKNVGVYRFEAESVEIFSRISGQYTTILGFPMVYLLRRLQSLGFIRL